MITFSPNWRIDPTIAGRIAIRLKDANDLRQYHDTIPSLAML